MSESEEHPVVTTASGKVRGTVQYTNDLPDKPVYTFKGIPYAAPPVGDLRFLAPQPAVPWEGVRDATELGAFCSQDTGFFANLPNKLPHTITSEDCLTVNVDTPTLTKDAGLPVLLWIHGGGLILGMGEQFPYTSLAAHQDVVVVSFNYRCGPFGFLSTGDEHAPGNVGFLDQVQAMVWVQDNIRDFGGDPKRVTIFGQSAGGASVCFHVVSPLSKGLFQRAISQSGVCQTMPVEPKPLTKAVMLAEDLNCDTKDTASMMACLRQKSADDIVASHNRLFEKVYGEEQQIPFRPTVDGVFLPAHPNTLLDKGQFNTGSYLLGVNNHEYGILMLSITHAMLNFSEGMSDETFLRMLKDFVKAHYPLSNQDDIAEVLHKKYKQGNQGDPMTTLIQYTHLLGDQIFVAPTIAIADKIAASGQAYLYENQYIPSFLAPHRPDWVGCDHEDDIMIVAGAPMLDLRMQDGGVMSFSKEDRKTSLDYMAYWANFARTGNTSDPTGGPADSPTVPEWPQYTPDNPAYMKLNLTSSADVGLHPERMALWNDVIPKLAVSSHKDEL